MIAAQGREQEPIDLGGRGGDDDPREALFNDGAVGPAASIQLPAARITRLPAIVIDLDPGRLQPGNPYFPPSDDPEAFHAGIRPALDRHPLARHAEIRSSGRGLHAIVRIEPAVELTSSADQEHWGTIVEAVRLSLPADLNAPGITSLTRPLGSINSKNGAEVRLLREAEPVTPEDIIGFVAALKAAPFKVLAGILLGTGRIEPCPACEAEGSSLAVLDHAGRCYGCGTVRVEALLDRILLAYGPPGRIRPSGRRPGRGSGLGGRPRAAGSDRTSVSEPTEPTEPKEVVA